MTHAKEGYSVPAKSHASPADGEAALSDHDSHRLAELCPRCRHRGQAIAGRTRPRKGLQADWWSCLDVSLLGTYTTQKGSGDTR